MRFHPFHPLLVAGALALIGATAFSASLIVGHGRRPRRAVATTEAPDEPPPPPRPEYQAPWATPAPPPAVAAPPARGALQVRVVGPHGLLVTDAEVQVVRRSPDATLAVELEAGEGDLYASADLERGRYDLSVSAEGLRTTHVSDVPTDGDVVTVALERGPVLHGVVGSNGSPAGINGCVPAIVIVTGPASEDGEDGQQTRQAETRDDCTFSVDDLPARGPLTVGVRRDDEPKTLALVTLPEAGDPAFLCLEPPCGLASPASASVAIYVADAAGRLVGDAAIEWTLVNDDTRGEVGSSEGRGFAFLHGRRVGETLQLVAKGDDEAGTASVPTTVTVGAGVTDVVLTLSPSRPSP